MTSEVLRALHIDVGDAPGREGELAALLRELDEARVAQRGRVVFIRGPRGVGKSYLVSRFVSAAQRRGAEIFEGGSGREVQQAWSLVAPLIAPMLAAASRSGVSEAKLAALAAKVGALRDAGATSERVALFDAVGELVTIISRTAPVVVFPDVDVADRSSLELLRYVLALVGAPGQHVGGLFVVTLRDDLALPAPLVEVLERVSARTLSLTGLDLEGIRSFLSRSEVAHRLLEVTGGNPDALGELVERPVGAVDFFMRRVVGVTGLAREVLEVLALVPVVTVGALASSLGTDAALVARALDTLAANRFVTPRVVDGRASWRFAREQDRDVFAGNLTEDRRRVLSVALARALAEAGEPAAAANLVKDCAPDEAARFGLLAALELLRRGALEDACELLARGHHRLSRDERALSAREWGRALFALGAFRLAARRLLEAARLSGNSTPLLAAAQACVKLGRFAHVEALLPHIEDTRSAKVIGAQVLLARNRADQAIAAARVIASGGSDAASAEARQIIGKAQLVRGAPADARVAFHEAAAAARALGLNTLEAQARLNEGVAAWRAGEKPHAIACWEACCEVDDRVCRAHALANLGSAWAESGDFEHAERALMRALDSFARFGSAREMGLAASNLGRLLHLLGDFERAHELGQYALNRATALGDTYLIASAQLTLGAVMVDQEMNQAIAMLDDARTGFEQVANPGFAALAAGLKARAHLARGERAQAELELGRASVSEGIRQLDAAMLEVELTRGELCLAGGDLLGATKAATRAREALLARPDLDGPVRTHALVAKLRLAAGDLPGAQVELQRAARLLEELAQRVPLARRPAFLAAPRRAEVLASVEPGLTLPRPMVRLGGTAPVERLHGFIGRSAALQRIVRQLEPVGRSSATVLVRGESGTGKELLAEAIHALSARRRMPLVKVNCAAMVEELLLSELFGHEKGAFTGAVRERKGRFELADGGSIFLDEIGDISPKAQVALLRVLQEREFERVGGSKTLKVDVRVICATNRDLESLMTQGRFRADLYYRLKGVMLELPPLRDRLDDLPLLAQAFLDRLSTERGEPSRRLAEASLALLARHDWPGNVRELENVISTAAIFAEGHVITPEAFSHVAELAELMVEVVALERVPDPVTHVPHAAPQVSVDHPIDWFELARARDISLKDLRHEVEMQCIRRALGEAQGNISEAARLLKMKRSRLSQIVNAEPDLKELAHAE